MGTVLFFERTVDKVFCRLLRRACRGIRQLDTTGSMVEKNSFSSAPILPPMAYSDFSLRKAKQDFGLTIQERGTFLPAIEPIAPSAYLVETLQRNIPLAIALGNEKARSELLICPILLEVREILERQVSLFSGSDFTVAPELGLSGVCDFLISCSPEQLFIEAPAIIVIEAKKEDLNPGMGQCLAEMVAAQHFNAANGVPLPAIYGTVTTGTLWRFLKLSGQDVAIDLTDYSIPPVETLLGILVTLVQGQS
ncbi:MAG: hypothetical protein WCD18_09445, partial [Thermosynechococcaceae cyanobacterium]